MENQTQPAAQSPGVSGQVPRPTAFKSEFAILDVTDGRAGLLARVRKGEKVHVVITGILEGNWAIGPDDGVSREFSVSVSHVQETTP